MNCPAGAVVRGAWCHVWGAGESPGAHHWPRRGRRQLLCHREVCLFSGFKWFKILNVSLPSIMYYSSSPGVCLISTCRRMEGVCVLGSTTVRVVSVSWPSCTTPLARPRSSRPRTQPYGGWWVAETGKGWGTIYSPVHSSRMALEIGHEACQGYDLCASPLGSCNVSQAHREKQRKEEAPVRGLHRVCSAAYIAWGIEHILNWSIWEDMVCEHTDSWSSFCSIDAHMSFTSLRFLKEWRLWIYWEQECFMMKNAS